MQITFEIELTMQQAFHIQGEGQNNTTAQRPLIKTQDGYPFIPASTLKGCLRCELETLLISEGNVAPDPENLAQPGPGDPEPGLIELLFGTAWVESCLYFEDLHSATEPSYKKTLVRTSVGINRRRGVAQDQNLYSTELGPPLSFTGQMFADLNGIRSELQLPGIALLYGGLRLIERIGGSRSRGLGWCWVYVTDNSPFRLEEKKKAFQDLVKKADLTKGS